MDNMIDALLFMLFLRQELPQDGLAQEHPFVQFVTQRF